MTADSEPDPTSVEIPPGETGAQPTSQHEARRRRSVWKIAVPAVFAVAGLLFGVSSRAAHGTDFRSPTTNLADVVERADLRVKAKQHDVSRLRSQVKSAQAKAAQKGNTTDEAKRLTQEAERAADQAGLDPVTGDSLAVTLDDSTHPVSSLPDGGTPDWLVVHQQDVQSVVNALWRGGARGMMLMDQRIVSTSAVRCVGNTLILQGRVYSPPFTIKAIGDPVKLRAALDDDASVKIYRQYVDLVGLGYSVKVTQNDTIPAFTGAIQTSRVQVTQ